MLTCCLISAFRRLFVLFGSLLLTGSSLATTPPATAPPPDIFHLTATQFEEPFLPTAPTSPREDAALRQAIERYRARAVEDDFSAMTGYLAAFPQSGWRVAVLTNLGLLDYH